MPLYAMRNLEKVAQPIQILPESNPPPIRNPRIGRDQIKRPANRNRTTAWRRTPIGARNRCAKEPRVKPELARTKGGLSRSARGLAPSVRPQERVRMQQQEGRKSDDPESPRTGNGARIWIGALGLMGGFVRGDRYDVYGTTERGDRKLDC